MITRLPLIETIQSPDRSSLKFRAILKPDVSVNVFGFRPGSIQLKYGTLDVNANGVHQELGLGHPSRLTWKEPCLLTLKAERQCRLEITFHRNEYLLFREGSVYVEELMPKIDQSAPVHRVRQLMIEHPDTHLNLEDLAKHVNLNQYYLIRKFKKTYGLPPCHFLQVIRCYHALGNMFFENKKSIDVALETTFCDQSHFIRSFKKTFGITPKNMFKKCKTAPFHEEEPASIFSYYGNAARPVF